MNSCDGSATECSFTSAAIVSGAVNTQGAITALRAGTDSPAVNDLVPT